MHPPQETSNRQGKTVEEEEEGAQVVGMDLVVVEEMKVVVQDQAKANDPALLPALVVVVVDPDAIHHQSHLDSC